MMNKNALLEWYVAAGVDETIGDAPVDYFAAKHSSPLEVESKGGESSTTLNSAPVATTPPPAPSLKGMGDMPAYTAPSEASAASRALADQCQTIDVLEAAIRAFDGCAIKKTASKTVFADGNREAKILLIGEAPGYQEDVQGIPFCGPSGQLLDRMLAAIGLDRTQVLISNTVYWRPPGNRQPNQEETAICLPFVEKLIGLMAPKLLILSGGTATHTLLKKDQSISRLRGKFYDYQNSYMPQPVKTALLFHPSYLLRQPAQKRLAWADLLLIKEYLNRA